MRLKATTGDITGMEHGVWSILLSLVIQLYFIIYFYQTGLQMIYQNLVINPIFHFNYSHFTWYTQGEVSDGAAADTCYTSWPGSCQVMYHQIFFLSGR